MNNVLVTQVISGVDAEFEMDIFVGKTAGAFSRQKNAVNSEAAKKKRDRRKGQLDRRRSAREGIIVTLASKNEQRSGKDRRRI